MTTRDMHVPADPGGSATRMLQYVVATFFAMIVLIPLVAAVLNGFKSSGEMLISPFALPQVWKVENYTGVIQSPSFWQMLSNSTKVMLATAFGVVVLASMPAFVFSRMSFRGREVLFNFFMLGLLFPLAVAILPLYISLRQLNLVDSLWGVILPQIAFGLSANIFILRGFFASVPRELEEAAAIDGCSSLGFFLRVLLPLTRPALAVVAVLTMVASWNNFFLPLLVLNSETLYTLPLGIMQFQGQYSRDLGRVLAFISISLIPTIVFYLFAERQIVAGLTSGAVKG
jgi:raffinose/stachyose/melibiose transport system permease protein